MIVYHGTTTWKMHSLVSGDFSKNGFGLFVTDTSERAARYANAQASQEVSRHAFPLHACAVVVAIEVEDEPNWRRRSEKHASLDQCEANIRHGKIVEVQIGRPSRNSAREHTNVQKFQEQLPDVPVHILDSLKTIHNQY